MGTLQENPLSPFLEKQGVIVLDGGLATTLEEYGYDLNDDLWSARFLIEQPEAIERVHRDFLVAGADCLTTATYQATLQGFRRRGLSEAQGIEMLDRAIQLAISARNFFWEEVDHSGRIYPLVAASVGPYGAYLADGSEYSGAYNLGEEELYQFHLPKWNTLAACAADLLACETIPSYIEARALLRLLRATPDCRAWMSFSCLDGKHLCDGTPLVEVARLCDSEPSVMALGFNCTSPIFISSLVKQARLVTGKPIIVYPNSGERYDGAKKSWTLGDSHMDEGFVVDEWRGLGVIGIGGCCRVGPAMIRKLREQLLP